MHNVNMIIMAIASISMYIVIIAVDSMMKTCSIINKVRVQIIGISTLFKLLGTCQNSIRWNIVAMIICRSVCLNIILITIIIMIIIMIIIIMQVHIDIMILIVIVIVTITHICGLCNSRGCCCDGTR